MLWKSLNSIFTFFHCNIIVNIVGLSLVMGVVAGVCEIKVNRVKLR